MEDTVIALQNENVHPKTVTATEKLYFVRLNYSEKVQHMIFMICFVVLVITGFMLKIPEGVVQKLGGTAEAVFFARSYLHRIAGTLMILVSVYHVYYLIFKPAGRRWLFDMLPKFKDAKEQWQETLEALKEERKELSKKLEEVKKSSKDAWADLKWGFSAAYEKLEKAYEKAMRKFKGQDEEEPEAAQLVSSDTEAVSVAALATLSAAAANADAGPDIGGRTVEQLCAELLRPMLKSWLDQNLPGMVETMVQAEIKRLSEQANT